MVIRRGDVWWADLGEPRGSGPGGSRPVVVVQSDGFNDSRISTVLVAVITSNPALARMPGNVLIGEREGGLSRESVVNVTQVLTLDKRDLAEQAGRLHFDTMERVEAGLRLVLAL